MFEQVRTMACHGAKQLFALHDGSGKQEPYCAEVTKGRHQGIASGQESHKQSADERAPMFSLKSRQKSLL